MSDQRVNGAPYLLRFRGKTGRQHRRLRAGVRLLAIRRCLLDKLRRPLLMQIGGERIALAQHLNIFVAHTEISLQIGLHGRKPGAPFGIHIKLRQRRELLTHLTQRTGVQLGVFFLAGQLEDRTVNTCFVQGGHDTDGQRFLTGILIHLAKAINSGTSNQQHNAQHNNKTRRQFFADAQIIHFLAKRRH